MERVVEDADHVVDHRGLAHANAPASARHQISTAAHVLGTAAHGDVDITHRDGLRGRDDGLQTRTAQTVDIEGRHMLTDTRIDSGHTAQVGVTRLGHHDVTHGHMSDGVASHASTLQGSLDGDRTQTGRGNVLQRTAETTHSRTRCANNEDIQCLAHIEVSSGNEML